MPESAHPPIAANGLRTIPPRETGGNLDIRRLTVGSTLLLPVHVRSVPERVSHGVVMVFAG